MRILGTAVSLLALLAGPMPALAQQPAPAAAAAPAKINFSIPAQGLNGAILSFAQKAGIQVFYDVAKVQGLHSNDVTGNFTPQEALARLLGGTGLTYNFTSANAVSLDKPADAGDGTILPPVQVQGRNSTGTRLGPVIGYVARDSVSATKTAMPIIETPQSVTVITRQEMDAQGKVQDVRDILRYAPGTYISDDYDNRIESLLVRGFQPDQYLDGLKLLSGTFATLQVDPYMLERAELLEGPASVLYGQGSPGGIINMVSKRPTETPIHEIQLQGGTGDHFQGAFDIGGPLNDSGTLLYRITGLARTEQPVEHMISQRIDISSALTWKPDANTSITFLANYLHDPRGGYYDLLPYEGTLYDTPYGKIPRDFYAGQPDFYNLDRTQYSLGYDLEHRFNDAWSVRQNLRYIQQDMYYSEVQPVGLQPDGHTLQTLPYTDDEHDSAFTVDNEALGKFNTGPIGHNVVIGVDYQHQVLNTLSHYSYTTPYFIYQNFLAPDYSQSVSMPPINVHRTQILNQTGLYAQDQLSYKQWRLLLAGREDWAVTDLANHLNNTDTSQFARSFTGHVGLNYLFENGIAPYVSYSTSFQPTSGADASGAAFKPTTGTQEELGIKYQPPGMNALITGDIFNLVQDNVLTTDLTNPNYSVQTGQVRVRGAEFSAVASLKQGLNLRASFTHLDSKVTRSNIAGTQGNQSPDVPNNVASIWADYTLQQSKLQGFGFGGGVRFAGSSYANSTNTYKIPAYAVVDATMHYDLGNFRPALTGTQVQLNAENLLNSEYVSYCSNLGCRWGVGREVIASVGYRW